MSAPNSKPGGKKSHACGPCRRLKRKCDLQIPCGTCKSGRNTRIDECMANPAKPLNNIQELIAPNLKFGRIQKRSPSNSNNHSTSNVISNNVSNSNSPNTTYKRQRNSSSSIKSEVSSENFAANGNFSQFNLTKSSDSIHESPIIDQQVYPDTIRSSQTSIPVNIQPLHQYQTQSTMPQRVQIQSRPPQENLQQQMHDQQSIQQSNSNFPNFQYQNQNQNRNQLQQIPFNQIGMNQQQIPPQQIPQQQIPQQPEASVIQQMPQQSQTPQPVSQNQTAFPQQAAIPQQQQQQQQQFSAQKMFMDQNELLKKQVEAQLLKIQSLESENSQIKSHSQQLQTLLNKKRKSTSTSSPSVEGFKSSDNDYKAEYLNLLPSQIQTTVLVNFYLQNIDYIYHPLHHPSFKKECEVFWKNQEDVDIGWLAVLFMVLSLAAIHLPKGLINISSQEIEKSHKIWFRASRECISKWDQSIEDPKKFNIYTLQCFSLCQLYFYATKRAEALNEILEKAIKDALAMGLDKDDTENPNLLEVQMKRRLWWDICGCDSFRALSLGVKPFVISYTNDVPLPANSNDSDITPDSIRIHSNTVATDNSFNIYRAQMMKILNGIYEKEHEVQESAKELKTNLDKVADSIFKGLIEIDIELCDSSKGWFFQVDAFGNLPNLTDPRIQFQHHMLHTCICIHRFRIYQNYLSNGIPIAWEVGVSSARAMFQVYKRLRKIYDLKNPLFLAQIHQAFTGSIIQSMLLLLNHKIALNDQSALYDDIDWMLKDLEILGRDVFILKPEVLKESFKVLNALRKSINKKLIDLEKDQKDIVSSVFGGKDMTENYLQKCTVSFIIDKVDRRTSNELPVVGDNAFDYKNQLGTLVTSDLIEQSVQKFEHIRNFLKPQEEPEDKMEKQMKMMKAQADQAKAQQQKVNQAQQSGQNDENINPLIANSQFMMNQSFPKTESYPLSDTAHDNSNVQTTNGSNGNNTEAPEGFVRQTTPFEMNFTGIDSFWNDVGPQGIDELNNMYYSEFSGYKIV